MTFVTVALIVSAVAAGIYWKTRTSRRRPLGRRLEASGNGLDETVAAFRNLLAGLSPEEEIPQYPPNDHDEGSGLVSFYTIVRGDALKVAAVIAEKYGSYREARGPDADDDAVRAAWAIRGMVSDRIGHCNFRWGTNLVEYRLHRDQSDEFLFVEIMKRPR
jgi:hypothetical protein